MLRPSIFGESLFDDWMDDFPFGKEFEKAMFCLLYTSPSPRDA